MKKSIISEDEALRLGEFLKDKRKDKNMTITDIEEKSGINRADIHRLESGQKKRLNPFQLTALAESLEINSINLYILAGFITKGAITDFVKEKTDKRIEEQLKIISNTGAIKIPVYENLKEALGVTKKANPISYTTLFLDEESDYVGAFIEKSLMKPLISDNAIVIISKRKEILDGEIGVFYLNENLLIKKYIKKETAVILYSENNTEPPILVTANDKLEVLGKLARVINAV